MSTTEGGAATLQLTPAEQACIRAEEIFRAEVRRRLEDDSDRRPLGLWFLSSIVLGVLSWTVAQYDIRQKHLDTVRRAKWGIYSDALEFEGAVQDACHRFDYEAASACLLQYPKPRLFDFSTFGLDRLTFELESVGTRRDARAAAAARRGAADVWRVMESELRDVDWWTPLDAEHKHAIDAAVVDLVRKTMVAPFREDDSRAW